VVIAPQPVPSRANLNIEININSVKQKTYSSCCANMMMPGTALVPGVHATFLSLVLRFSSSSLVLFGRLERMPMPNV
jgi:hypothetical protein